MEPRLLALILLTKETISSTLLHIWHFLRHTGKNFGFIHTHSAARLRIFTMALASAPATFIKNSHLFVFERRGSHIGHLVSSDWNERFRSHGFAGGVVERASVLLLIHVTLAFSLMHCDR